MGLYGRNHERNSKGVRGDPESEGSCRQNPGLTATACEAAASGRGGKKIQSPMAIRRVWLYMRQVYGMKILVLPWEICRFAMCYRDRKGEG